MSNIFKRLMERLGFEKYFVLGGDWGSFIIADMATLYPENVIAAHSTSCIVMSNYANLRNMLALTFPSIFIPEEFRKYASSFSEFVSFQAREMGYAHIQATKPDTVGAALTHSPLGLAAYILEKLSTWTNRTWISREDGGILENFSLDELLDNVMIYWVTGSITTSQRLYSENLIPTRKPLLDTVPTHVPFDCQIFAGDLNVIPEFVARIRYTNIQRFTVYDKGDHFAAFEVPEILAAEAVSYFNTL